MTKKPKMRVRFKDPAMQRMYATCRALGNTVNSEFYHQGKPRHGASHRNAYWNGREGKASRFVPRGTLAWAAYRAGCDDRKRS